MIEIIITAVVSIFTTLGGTFLFFPQIRTSKILENEAKQSEEWHKLYVEEKERREEDRKQWENERISYESRITSLYQRIAEVRDEKADIRKKNTELEVENTRLKLLKCELPSCLNRKPPTGF